jgi:diadenosine tetraphosphatase ApaH/serine/threonine PP2A family protein phosphatase
VADVHSNLSALEAVLAVLPPVDAIWALGDHVGYGPQPAEVLALLRERGAVMIAGNHDHAIAADSGEERFPNKDAAEAAHLQRTWLSSEDREFLGDLPTVTEVSGTTLVHGSLRAPLTEYIFDTATAAATMAHAVTAVCCHGHTHIPSLFSWRVGGYERIRPSYETTYSLAERALVNPGSVGQPRDGDARAAWAILEPEGARVTFFRTPYAVGETQRRMHARGLPGALADRLQVGR